MIDFKGVVAATITPFTPEGQLNEEAFRQVIESNIKAGIDGFWISGGTGESVLLTGEEVIRTAEISVEICRKRAFTIVHVGTLTTSDSVHIARGARTAGVDAIACVPPFFYHPSDQAIIDHYKAVVGGSDTPLFVYNQPKYTGVEFTPLLMERIIKEIPQVVGIKHSAPDFNNIRRFADLGLAVFTGSGSLFLSALAAGAVGVVDGPLTVAPELWVGAFRAYNQGDMSRARGYQQKANRLIDLAAKFGMQATCKALTGIRMGINCGSPRLPIPALSDQEKSELIKAARCFGLIPPVNDFEQVSNVAVL